LLNLEHETSSFLCQGLVFFQRILVEVSLLFLTPFYLLKLYTTFLVAVALDSRLPEIAGARHLDAPEYQAPGHPVRSTAAHDVANERSRCHTPYNIDQIQV
jgi:hypothetical protein